MMFYVQLNWVKEWYNDLIPSNNQVEEVYVLRFFAEVLNQEQSNNMLQILIMS